MHAGFVSLPHIRNRAHGLRLSQGARVTYMEHIDTFCSANHMSAGGQDETLNNVEFARLFAKMTQQ
jgi:hypothetical protein